MYVCLSVIAYLSKASDMFRVGRRRSGPRFPMSAKRFPLTAVLSIVIS